MKRIGEYFKDSSRLLDLSPLLLLILTDVILWAESKQLNIVITDTVTDEIEDAYLDRVSSTHREGRAFDVSTRGWSKDLIDECVRVFSFKYRQMGAIGQDGNPKPVYFHDSGHGPHLHFQVHKRYAMAQKFYD